MKFTIKTILPALLIVAALSSTAFPADDSILIWNPPADTPPQYVVRVESFKYNDLGITGHSDFWGDFWPFGSVIKTFADQNPNLRKKFQQDFSKYLAPNNNALHPQSQNSPAPNLELYTYLAPYEYQQAEFIQWLQQNTDRTDFLSPAARKFNDYKGNLNSPIFENFDLVTPDALKKTNGYAAILAADHLRLTLDNRYNPMRWIGPMNIIQHHEQPALALLLRSKPGQWELANRAFQAARTQDSYPHLILEYDVDLEINDFRPQMNEFDIWDFYRQTPLAEANDIIATTHYLAETLTIGLKSHDHQLTPIQRRDTRKWLNTRLINHNLQVSLMVNFKERDNRYRLAEFMLASKNQQPIFLRIDPETKEGLTASANPDFDQYAVDGGCNGIAGWWRVPINIFDQQKFITANSITYPVILKGGEYIDVPDGGITTKNLTGQIDLSNFYKVALANNYFPGQKSYAAKKWIGFQGDDPTQFDPQESHGIEWLGILFENHGPFRINLKINKLNIYQKQ